MYDDIPVALRRKGLLKFLPPPWEKLPVTHGLGEISHVYGHGEVFGRKLSFLGIFLDLADGTAPVSAQTVLQVKVNMRIGEETVMKDFPDQQSARAYIVEHPAPDVVVHPQGEHPPPLPCEPPIPIRAKPPETAVTKSAPPAEQTATRRCGRLGRLFRNAILWETGYSALIADLVTVTRRDLTGFSHLFSGSEVLFAFFTSLLVLNLTYRLSGKRSPRDYILALAGTYILLVFVLSIGDRLGFGQVL